MKRILILLLIISAKGFGQDLSYVTNKGVIVTGKRYDSAAIKTLLDGKLFYSDTTNLHYVTLASKVKYTDTATMLTPYLRTANSFGYTLSVQALTSSPTDAQTIYFGNMPKAPTTTAAISKIYIRKAGTIKIAEIYCFSGTAGTNEAWVLSIRKNNTTDTQIASVSLAASERVFSNTGLSIAVAAGDYIEIKSVNPTWATNPLTTIFGG